MLIKVIEPVQNEILEKLFRKNSDLSFMRKDFNYLCPIWVEKW